MSLLVDPDYAIYALRLAYLRKIDDHAGPRVITFPSILNLPIRDQGTPSRTGIKSSSGQVTLQEGDIIGVPGENSVLSPLPANSHVVVAGLNDARYQPELAILHSPKLNNLLSPSEDSQMDLFGPSARSNSEAGGILISHADGYADGTDRRKGSGGLKYTSTILGPGRSGALGMRVNGRRATSGDVQRRTRGGSKDDSLLEINSVKEHSSDLDSEISKPSLQSNRQSDLLPIVQFDAQRQQRNKSGRASSFRLPDDSRTDNLALASLRTRSSSQPYHPAMSSGLRSVGAVDEEENLSAEEVVITTLDDKLEQLMPKSTLPPSRPPRSSHRSESSRTQGATPMSLYASTQGSTFSHLRRRSASEGANHFLPLSIGDAARLDNDGGEISKDRGDEEETELLREERPSATKAMPRMNSSTTILSLASPLNLDKRDLSPNSRPNEYNSQHLSPMSSTRDTLASYQLAINPSDTSSPATSRYRTISSSPLSKKPTLSDSIENGDNAFASSSYRLGHSSGSNSVDKIPSLLYESTAGNLAEATEIDQALEEEELSSSLHADARISSALGLDMAWSEDDQNKNGGHLDTLQSGSLRGRKDQRKKIPSPMKFTKQYTAKQLASQRQARSDTQQQQWFTSLKSDRDMVARRFQLQPQKSGISALLSQHSQGPSNPFAAMYKHVAGGSVSSGSTTTVEVYFPFANEDLTKEDANSGAKAIHLQSKSMSLTVRKDATMEEIIGYSLYCYVEEGWSPRLDENLSEESSQEEREIKMSTLGWTLRIVEDGEVDDDYPAIDRSMLVGKFGADELAICEATVTQIKQHLAALPKVQRRPVQSKQVGPAHQTKAGAQHPFVDASKQNNAAAILGPSARIAAVAGNTTAGSLVNFGGTPIFASSALSKSIMTPVTTSIFLRVLITPNPEVKYKTTLQVPSDMYLADILETICRKRQLADVDQWAFVVPEQNIVVPLDRTVESLQGNHDLALVRRQDLGHQAGSGALTGQSTNPNASIFKRFSEPVHNLGGGGGGGGKGIASTYKSYTVNRKQASFLGRHERILTIDGDWIHIIPTDTRAFQAQTHTTSFPISVIAKCYQSRIPSAFKLIVARETDQKRYEFEAENSIVAAEIVDEINSLIKRTR